MLKLRSYNESISGDLSRYLDCSTVEFTAKIRKNTTCLVYGTDSENLVYDTDSSKFQQVRKDFYWLVCCS